MGSVIGVFGELPLAGKYIYGAWDMDTLYADMRGVNILDLQQILALAQDITPAGRVRLAEAVSNFFAEQELSQSEERLASEILLNLIRQAETDLRQALAEKLAHQDSAPHELVIFLANDEASVAAPVLLHSPLLSDIDLMYVIAGNKRSHAELVAQRERISPMVADKLIDTRDPGVILKLMDNQRVHLQKGSMKKLVKVALTSEELQAPLLRRPEVDADIAVSLYMVVSNAMRADLAKRFPIQGHMVELALEQLIQELTNEAVGVRLTTPEMMALARRFQERGGISADLLIRTLRRGQMGFFMALFAARIDARPDQVRAMVQQDQGRPFVLACRAIGMMKSEFASIFLLSRGIRSGDKIVDQRELAQALKYYDSLKEHDIERMLQAWLRAYAAATA